MGARPPGWSEACTSQGAREVHPLRPFGFPPLNSCPGALTKGELFPGSLSQQQVASCPRCSRPSEAVLCSPGACAGAQPRSGRKSERLVDEVWGVEDQASINHQWGKASWLCFVEYSSLLHLLMCKKCSRVVSSMAKQSPSRSLQGTGNPRCWGKEMLIPLLWGLR